MKDSKIVVLFFNSLYFLAESKRFELLIPFRVYTLSRRAPSTTRTTLQFFQDGKNTGSHFMHRIFFPHLQW